MATAADEGVRYRDKVTIVTGGAQGIGRACVEVFGKLLFLQSFNHMVMFYLIVSLTFQFAKCTTFPMNAMNRNIMQYTEIF